MYKQFVISSIFLIIKNYFYLFFIFINLFNCLSRLSANPEYKSFQNKCPSIEHTLGPSEYELSKHSEEFLKEFSLNNSLKLIGINKKSGLLSKRRRHNSPPQYMIDLYSMVSNTQNDNIIHMKYDSKTIRSISHSDTSSDTHSSHLHFYFNLSQLIGSDEHILEAEFHIYKLRVQSKVAERREDPKHNLLEVKVYQMLSKENNEKNRLLDVRRMSTHSFGWDVFYVKPAVLDWIRNESSNYGLLITVKTLLEENLKNGIRFVNRYQNHINKQPMIVIFSTDNKLNSSFIKSNEYNSKYDYGFSEFNESAGESKQGELGSLVKEPNDSDIVSNGMTGTSSSKASNVCSRRELSIDFEGIGWSSPIILPKAYKTYLCEGKCINPVNQNSFAKSDTTFRSVGLLHQFYRRSAYTVKRCCVANKFSPLNVLYFDERANVVLKRIDDLIAHSCSCR